VRVLVVGAGVIGLTCALRLLESGHEVAVVARELSPDTTSDTAAALWYPYRAFPRDRVLAWSARSYDVFRELAADERTGVRLRRGTELLRQAGERPWWAEAVADLQRLPADRTPIGYAGGWRFTAPVADMSHYLPWLAGRVAARGGSVTRGRLDRLDDGFSRADLVVDCAGLGAALLADDPSVTPVRGQVVYVRQVGLGEWLLDQGDPRQLTYVVPRAADVVLGGTAEEGATGTKPDPLVAAAILERCRALVPALRDAEVVGHRVGLRPVRPAVRVEVEQHPAGPVVHCYGHGGAGVTLSWGCADEVVGLVRSVR